MTTDGGGSARQASIDGVGGRATARFGAVTCWLAAPVVPVVWFFEDSAWVWWEVLAAVGALGVTALIGFAMWSAAERAKADTRRLRQAGRPAVAEIIGLDVADPDEGSADIAVLSLRISGDDVPPFEATYRCDHHPFLEVGACFEAVVDPSDNLFTLELR